MELQVGSKFYEAVIDTGAESSVIRKDICSDEDIPVIKGADYQVLCSNTTKEKANTTAVIKCCIKEIDHHFTQEFKALTNLSSDIILGMDFII
ncbi:hypothetical protein HZS_6118, partial [Henneguya salminicola]